MAPAPHPLSRAPTPPLLACAPRTHSGRLGPRGRPSRWVPALTHRPQARVAPARGTRVWGPPPASPRGRHAPSPRAARAARPLGREVASPNAGRSGGRRPRLRPPPGPTAARLRLGPDGRRRRASGGGLFSAGVSPRPRRGSRGDWGGGGERGLGRKGERGKKGGNQTRKGRKGGRGKIRRGRKALSPPPAAACALRHHVQRSRQRVLRRARPCFLCVSPGCFRRPLSRHPLAPTTHKFSSPAHLHRPPHSIYLAPSVAPSALPVPQASNPDPLRFPQSLLSPSGLSESPKI